MIGRRKSAYLPAATGLFEMETTKSQLQQVRIVQTAIKSFARHGIEKTTYTNLSKECGISRTLVHHYFPTLDSLFLLAARYARQTLLGCTQEGLAVHPHDERKQLEGYISGCFKWVELFPDQGKFWMLYFYQASLGGLARTENSVLVRAGHERIKSLILSGQEKEYFKFKDAQKTAKAIQVLITGGIVTVITEDDFLTVHSASEFVHVQVEKLLS